jgi:enamine deaminase RidA (YjgF/YER057c/UK114 family)
MDAPAYTENNQTNVWALPSLGERAFQFENYWSSQKYKLSSNCFRLWAYGVIASAHPIRRRRAKQRSPRGEFTVNLQSTQDTNQPRATQTITRDGLPPATAEWRLKELGINLPAPPEPFGIYVEAVQTGNLLFLTGMLPTEGRSAKFVGRIGAELDVETGRKAAHLAALNGLAVAREHLGSLDKVSRVVRLGISVATSGDVREQPKVADGASELLKDVFGKHRNPSRLVYGVASLPLGVPVALEIIFEVAE